MAKSIKMRKTDEKEKNKFKRKTPWKFNLDFSTSRILVDFIFDAEYFSFDALQRPKKLNFRYTPSKVQIREEKKTEWKYLISLPYLLNNILQRFWEFTDISIQFYVINSKHESKFKQFNSILGIHKTGVCAECIWIRISTKLIWYWI